MERKIVCLGHPQLKSTHEIQSRRGGKQAAHMAKHNYPLLGMHCRNRYMTTKIERFW
jgi:hypothetical protein